MILDDKTHPCCKANIVDHGKYVGRAEIATRHECLKCRKLSTTWSTTDEREKIKCYRMRRNSPQSRLMVQGSSSSPELFLVIFMLKIIFTHNILNSVRACLPGSLTILQASAFHRRPRRKAWKMNILPIVIDGWQQCEPGRCEKDAVDSAKGRESHRHGDKEGKLAVEPASKCLQRLIVLICDRKPKQNSPQPLPQNQGLRAHWELCRRQCLLSRRRWWRWYKRSWLLGGDLWLGPSSPQSQSWGSSNHCKQRVLRGEEKL